MPSKIIILDFDQTITIKHTFQNRQLSPKNNIKSGVNPIIKEGSPIISIATFHNDPDYIMTYLSDILGIQTDKPLEKTNFLYNHDQLTVYQYEGMTPILISTIIHEDNKYNIHKSVISVNGKNTQITHIFDYLNELKCLDNPENEVHFYDDDRSNFLKAKYKLKTKIPSSVKSFIAHHVNRGNPDFEIIESYSVLDSQPIKNDNDVKEAISPNPLNQAQDDIPLPYSQHVLIDDNSDRDEDYFLNSWYENSSSQPIKETALNNTHIPLGLPSTFLLAATSLANGKGDFEINGNSGDSFTEIEEIFLTVSQDSQPIYYNYYVNTVLDNSDTYDIRPNMHSQKRKREHLDNSIEHVEPKRKEQMTSSSLNELSIFNKRTNHMTKDILLNEFSENNSKSWS